MSKHPLYTLKTYNLYFPKVNTNLKKKSKHPPAGYIPPFIWKLETAYVMTTPLQEELNAQLVAELMCMD